jgi:CHAT domain-containing protein
MTAADTCQTSCRTLPWQNFLTVPFLCACFITLLLLLTATTLAAASRNSSPEKEPRTSTDQTLTQQSSQRIDALLKQGAIERSRGNLTQALQTLTEASIAAEKIADPDRKALALAGISDVYLLNRQTDAALEQAETALVQAGIKANPAVLASVLNYMGNVKFTQQRYASAIKDYQNALQSAQSSDQLLAAKLTINILHALQADNQSTQIKPFLKQARTLINALPDSADKASLLIALGSFPLQAESELISGNDLQNSLRALESAEAIAHRLQTLKLQSYALGYQAEYYARQQQEDKAFLLFQRALFFAHQADASELLARWYWQRGRLLKSVGKLAKAEADYRLAIDYLATISAALIFGRRGDPYFFRQTVGSIYRELVAILLARYDAGNGNTTLKDVVKVMERYKTVELKSYFMDDCVSQWQENFQTVELDQLGAEGTAIIYPVVFQQRTVLLFSIAQGDWEYREIPVSADELQSIVKGFRRQLTAGGNSRRLKKYGLILYKWFIRPIEQQLKQQHIDTLVFVPDGLLRTIPFSALYDGQDYLIQRYAFALSPGLELTYAKSGAVDYNNHLFVGGLSKSVGGFPPLYYVPQEIEKIAQLSGSRQLLDESFNRTNIKAEMQNHTYSILHFATHTRIENDPRKSFLLTFDDKIAFPELHQFVQGSSYRDLPIDLLVLSACDTAIGDERAALGLAGVAIKAGASSVVASLWSVSDESTAELMPVFFDNLINKQIPKAKALQAAQQLLLTSEDYYPPYFWAAFVLIGDWR